ncbi:NAD(P)-dependent oxidoreductase [Gammaproteobacteria bacterium]|nr:NAD(P)-dependent oxidoreductase [Gammaproteobacteria bacterium]
MTTMNPSVSVIGIGQMGLGIANNIQNAGYLNSIFEINTSLLNQLENDNDVIVNNPKLGLISSNILIFVVPSTQQIRDFLFSGDWIDNIEENTIIIDLTTSNPDETKKLSKELSKRKINYIDCGMTGGAQGAEKGTLTLMMGGKKNIIKSVTPVLESFTNRLIHVGIVGSGHALKLIHNMVTHTIFLATVEGVIGAKKLGIDPEVVIDVFNSGNARSFISESRFPNHILSEKWDARSRVSNLFKDLSMVTNLLNDNEIVCPYGELTTDILKNAVSEGLADVDFSLLYNEYEKLIDK